MKIPVAQDKKNDHIRFCKSAKELIEAVTQKPVNDKIPDPKDLTQVKHPIVFQCAKQYSRNIYGKHLLYRIHILLITKKNYYSLFMVTFLRKDLLELR